MVASLPLNATTPVSRPLSSPGFRTIRPFDLVLAEAAAVTKHRGAEAHGRLIAIVMPGWLEELPTVDITGTALPGWTPGGICAFTCITPATLPALRQRTGRAMNIADPHRSFCRLVGICRQIIGRIWCK